MSGLERLLHNCHGKDETTLFLMWTTCWLTQSSEGLLRILASFAHGTGVPLAWHKFSRRGTSTPGLATRCASPGAQLEYLDSQDEV